MNRPDEMDDLLHYYENELSYFRENGKEFANRYPKIAGRLRPEPDKCEDPHTERLIEAFAFISGRIHRKIDETLPLLSESLLNIIYPHFTNPVPSMSVVRFEPDKERIPKTGYRIEKQTALYSRTVNGIPCQFSTSYPLTLWPIEVVSAEICEAKGPIGNARQAMVINLRAYNNLCLDELEFGSLRFFLNGTAQNVFHLYELLFNSVCHVECALSSSREGAKAALVSFAVEDIKPVGFAPEEAMIPSVPRSFPGYILLLEYFCFPQKFLFFDLKGLERLRAYKGYDTIQLRIILDKAAKSSLLINKDTFRLNCTPVINLFGRITEPVRVDHRKAEYRVIPDIGRLDATEIFGINKVASSSTASGARETEFSPFYSSVPHQAEKQDIARNVFWHMQRRPSGRTGDDGTDVFLSFSDWDLNPSDPEVETLIVHTDCSNRDLPARLPFGNPKGDFEMEAYAPVAGVHCLIKPTPTRRASLQEALQWQLVSHLSLNYLSLVGGGEDALKEILKLYDFEDSPGTRQQIDGIVSLQAEYISKRIGRSTCRGVRTTIEFDENKFVGSGVYLFAGVLEKFLGLYVSVNSFSQLVAKTLQRKEVVRKWPPRNSERIFL